MLNRDRFRCSRALLFSLVVAALALSCDETTSNRDGGEFTDGWTGKCTADSSLDFKSAIALKADEQKSGFICPRTDRDYYKITVPSGDKLLRLNVQYITPAPKLTLTYQIYDANEKIVGRAASDTFNKFNAVHCLDPGTYYLMVLDDGDDAFDTKNPYTVSFSTEKDQDANEGAGGNDTQATATKISGSQTGYISCQGDVDYYSVSAGADQLLHITLAAKTTTNVDLQYTVYDNAKNPVAVEFIADGMKVDAKLDLYHAVPKAGTYYIAVEDKDSNEADPKTSYTLTVATVAETDPQDKGGRNDTPAKATVVGTYSGGATLSKTYTGHFNSKSDVDWFVVNGLGGLSANNPGVMEVTLTVPAGKVALDPAFAMIYPDGASTCTKDACCRVLAGSDCVETLNCVRKTYTCIQKGDSFCLDATCSPSPGPNCPSERACAGTASCLPTKTCGAEAAFRVGRNKTAAATVRTAQLLIHPGPWYIRVYDQGDDEYEYGRQYSLKIAVRMDPDGAKELDTELWPQRCQLVEEAKLADREWELHVKQANTKIAAKTIAVGQWVTGYISYEGDIDFYKFANPCPGADCTLTIEYKTGGGCPASGAPLRYCQNLADLKNAMGLEFLYAIRKTWGDDPYAEMWTGFVAKPGESGAWGAASGKCVYSYDQHGSKPYFFTVEDMGMNLWSWTCSYQFRVVKTADGCVAPCKTHPVSGNCGA